MNESALASVSQIFSGSAVIRGMNDSRAVMVGDLDGSGLLSRQLTFVGAPPSGSASALRLNDVVISLRGNTNFAAIVDHSDISERALFATLDLAVIRLHDPEVVDPSYVATWLNLPSTQAILAESREGTAAKRLSLGPLRAIEIPVPDWRRQRAIVSLAQAAAEERRLSARITMFRTKLLNECLALAALGPTEESAT